MTPGLQVISESKEAEIDRGIWKIILLAALGIVASAASVSGFNRLLSGWSALYFWPTLVVFFLFLVIVVLQVFFVKGRGKLALIAFLECLVPLAVFWDRIYPQPDVVLLIGAALVFIFLLSAMDRGRRLLFNSVRINFWGTARAFLSHAALGFIFLFTALLYLNYFSWGSFDAGFGRTLVEEVLTSSKPITGIIVPGVSLSGTAGEFFNDLAASQLRDSSQPFLNSAGEGMEAQFRYLPPKDQEKIVAQFSAQLEKVFRERFGDFNSSDKISDIAFSVIATYAAKLNASSPWLIPVIVCIVFFLFLKGILALIYWLVALFAFMIFKILIAFNFAHIASEERNREFVMLS